MFYEHDGAIYNLMTLKRAVKKSSMHKKARPIITMVYYRDWFDLYFETTEMRDTAYETIKGRLSEIFVAAHIVGGLH
jgi:hypothetical protein